MNKLFEKIFTVETELSVEEIVKRLNSLKLLSKERYSDGLNYVNSSIYGCISGKIDSEGFRFSTFGRPGLEFPIIAKGGYSNNSQNTSISVSITPVYASIFLFFILYCIFLVLSYFAIQNIDKCDGIFCDEALILLFTFIFPFLTYSLFTSAVNNVRELMIDVLEAKEIDILKNKEAN